MRVNSGKFLYFGIAGLLAAVSLAIFGVVSSSADDRNKTEQILLGSRSGDYAPAKNGEWIVADASGAISYGVAGNDGTRRTLSKGTVLGPSHQVESGTDGWALLTHGADTISVSANSRMTLPEKPDGTITRILQDLGTLLFQVDKRPGWDFQVETPHLVAGVKGTTFGVNVTDQGSSVSVSEGTVGVSSAGDGDRGGVDVTAGHTANVSAESSADVNVAPTTGPKGPATSPTSSTKSAGAPGQTGKKGSGGNSATGGGAGRGNSGGNKGGNNAGGNQGDNEGGGGNSGGNSGGGNSGGNSGGGNSGGNSGGGNSGGNSGGGNSGGNSGGGNSGGNSGGNNGGGKKK